MTKQVTVPVEATEKMLQVAKFIHSESAVIDYAEVYKAMIAAAPQPKTGEDHQVVS